MELRDFCKLYSLPFSEGSTKHTTQGWVQLKCPLCDKGGNSFHLGWSEHGRYMNCWRCGSMNPWTTLRKMNPSIPREEIQKVCRFMVTKVKFITGHYKPPENLLEVPEVPVVRKYLRERMKPFRSGAFPEQLTVDQYSLKAIGIGGRFQWRLFIPIHEHGIAVSWTTRSVGNVEPRYLAAKSTEESVAAKSLLFGWDKVRHAVIIHEGFFDVATTGFGSVSTMGIGYTQSQFNRMISIPKRIICFDNDNDAQKRAKKLMDDLSVYPGETSNVVLSGKDANSSPKSEIAELRKMLI